MSTTLCPHKFRDLTEEELAEDISVSAYCKDCNFNFGWRCKNSPDSVCHYYTVVDRDRISCVGLIDGTLHHNFPREGWAPEYETYNRCLYCKK